MNSYISYTICIFIYSFLFALSYVAPQYKNVCFGVLCNPKAKAVINEIKKFRFFFSELSIYFFIFSVVFLFFTSEINFLSFFITLYLFILIIKFNKSNRVMKEIVLCDTKSGEKHDSFISVKFHHYSLHLFTVLYIIYISYREKTLNPELYTNIYSVNSLTAIFILSLIPFIYLFLKNAPDFAEKRVKQLFYNFTFLVSFAVIFALYSFSSIIMYYDFTLSFYTLFYLAFLIFLCVIFSRYINKLNKPYPFKAESGTFSSKRLIESSIDGTKIFINLKNKKAILITSAMALYVIIYLSAVYLLTIK